MFLCINENIELPLIAQNINSIIKSRYNFNVLRCPNHRKYSISTKYVEAESTLCDKTRGIIPLTSSVMFPSWVYYLIIRSLNHCHFTTLFLQ